MAKERMTGIEPALSAWEAEVLPLNYIRVSLRGWSPSSDSVILTRGDRREPRGCEQDADCRRGDEYGEHNPRHQDRAGRRDDRLPAERLHGDEHQHSGVGDEGEHDEPLAASRFTQPTHTQGQYLEQQYEERQHLQRVHPDEVRDTQVAPDGAPPEQRQAGATVIEPDGVSAGDAVEVGEAGRRSVPS